MNCPCFAKRCGAAGSGRRPKSSRPAWGVCDVLIPTPSAKPYGYSIGAGGANEGVAVSEVNSVGSCTVLLGGSEGAVGWLMMISWVVMVVAGSRGGDKGSGTSGRSVACW